MARITSRSSSPMLGMPISSSGTPSSASARAMAIFSSGVKATPALCSPSRRVVSSMITLAMATSGCWVERQRPQP